MDEFLNKITQGDCLNLMQELPNESIDMILTDPPYGMSFVSNRRKEKHIKIKNDENLNWLSDFVSQAYRLAKNNSTHYFFCSFHNIDKFKIELSKKFQVKNILVWVKNNAGMGDLNGDFASKTEFVIMCRKGKDFIRGKRDSNVLFFNKTNNELHPTQKPIDLLEFLIEKFSDKGMTILDPFAGSGTTCLAALNSNRNFIGFELEQKYVDIANDLINNYQMKLDL